MRRDGCTRATRPAVMCRCPDVRFESGTTECLGKHGVGVCRGERDQDVHGAGVADGPHLI